MLNNTDLMLPFRGSDDHHSDFHRQFHGFVKSAPGVAGPKKWLTAASIFASISSTSTVTAATRCAPMTPSSSTPAASIACSTEETIINHTDTLILCYSYLNESTGLAIATRIDWKLTVSKAMASASRADNTKIPTPMLAL